MQQLYIEQPLYTFFKLWNNFNNQLINKKMEKQDWMDFNLNLKQLGWQLINEADDNTWFDKCEVPSAVDAIAKYVATFKQMDREAFEKKYNPEGKYKYWAFTEEFTETTFTLT